MLSHARELVSLALSQGVAITQEQGSLRLTGATDRLTTDFMARLREAKSAILAFLASCDERLTLRPDLDAATASPWSQTLHWQRRLAGADVPHLLAWRAGAVIDADALAHAAQQLLARHPILAGAPLLHGAAAPAADPLVQPIPCASVPDRDGAMALAQAHPPSTALPFRIVLLQTPAESVLLLLALSYVADLASLRLILQELQDSAPPSQAGLRFGHFAAAESRLRRHPATAERCREAALALGWQTPAPSAPAAFKCSGRLTQALPVAQWDELHRLSLEQGLLPAAMLSALVGAALVMGGERRAQMSLLNLPNRRARVAGSIIGPIESAVPVRMPSAAQTLAEYGAAVQRLHALAQDVQELPCAALGRESSMIGTTAELADMRSRPFMLERAPAAAVSVRLVHTGDGAVLELGYDADELTGSAAEALQRDLGFALEHARELMNCQLDALPAEPAARAAYLRERRSDPGVMLGMLCAIFAAVLALPQVEADGNFFELAGNSLSVAKVVSRVKREFGVAVSFSEVFRHPTPRGLAAVILGKGAATVPDLSHRAPLRELPAAPQQVRYFASYNVQIGPSTRSTVITGEWSSAAVFAHAVRHVVARHELLRTVFFESAGRLMQRIADHVDVPCPTVRLADAPVQAQLRELDALIRAEAFDLNNGPLVKVMMCEQADGKVLAAVSVFNGILDAFSEALLKDELALSCRLAEEDTLAQRPPLPMQYQDFARWQWDLRGAALEQARDYWTEQYPDNYRGFHLEEREGARAGEMRVFLLGEELSAKVALAAARSESSLFGYLLSNFVQLGAEIYGRDDVAVGLLYHGRENEELEKQIGYFVDMLCLKCDANPAVAFPGLVQHVNQVLFKAIDMRLFQYQDLCARFGASPADPVFPITGYHINNVIAPGHEKKVPAGFTGQVLALPYKPKFDFNIYVHESNRGILIRMAYATNVVDSARAAQLEQRFIEIVARNTAPILKELV